MDEEQIQVATCEVGDGVGDSCRERGWALGIVPDLQGRRIAPGLQDSGSGRSRGTVGAAHLGHNEELRALTLKLCQRGPDCCGAAVHH